MLRKEVVKLELMNIGNLNPYAHWVDDVVNACKPIWLEVIAKHPSVSAEQLEDQMRKIPFDAPDSTKMAVVDAVEKIGFDLAPAFVDMRLKLAPDRSDFYWMSRMGALAKGAEKLMDKLHHYLYMDLKDQPSFPPSYSNIIAMRGMMARDYGAIRNLLWVIGEHDIKAGFEVDLIDEGLPPQPVIAYDAVTDLLIKDDFFQWASLWSEELDVAS